MSPADRSWRDEILADGRALLSRIRAGGASDDEVQFLSGVDAEGHVTDQHLAARAGLLWALQYDHDATDNDLLRRLLAAEVAWCAVRPGQGIGDELFLAAFLVASDPRDGDIELMWAAKSANFDTWCGFDREFLRCRGIPEMHAVSRSGRSDVDGMLRYVGSEHDDVEPSDADVAAFLSRLAHEFPSDPQMQWPGTWVDRALALDRVDLASIALDDWASSSDPPDAGTLVRLLTRCGRFQAAAETQRSIIETPVDPVRGYFDLVRLVELHRLAGETDEGADAFQRVLAALPELADDNGYKHRCACEEGFALSLTIPDRETASEVFRAAHEVALVQFPPRDRHSNDALEYLPLVVLRAAAEAAEHVGDHETSSAYWVRANREAVRIGHPRPASEPGCP